MRSIVKRKEFGIALIIILLSIILTFLNRNFLTGDNLLSVAKSRSVTGIMALGMLAVLISGGIDLSISGTIAVSAVVCGKLMVAIGPSLNTFTGIPLIFAISIAVGCVIGALNGLIIAKLKIPPIVTTLGMQSILVGAVMFYTNGDWITNLPDWFKNFGNLKPLGISIQLIIFALCALVVWFFMKYTLFGRGVYAVGGNLISAQRVGYNTDSILIRIYMLSGAMAGLAGVVHTSIVHQVDPSTFNGEDLNVIVAVVIGGASTMGGVGTVFGTILGVVLMAILKNGMVLAKIPTFWQSIVMGAIILFAVSFDVINRKREQAKLERVDVED